MKTITATVLFLPFLLFSVLSAQTVVDTEGNTYPIVVVDGKEWMAENLRTTLYNDDTPITAYNTPEGWKELEEGAYAVSGEYESFLADYGKLYNAYAVQTGKLCPEGWQVPSAEQMEAMTEALDPETHGNFNNLGNQLKSQRQVNSPLGNITNHPRWDEHDQRYGHDVHGFAALPAGGVNRSGEFVNLGQYAYFWSSSLDAQNTAVAQVFLHSHKGMSTTSYPMQMGFSVRCIKSDDDTPPPPPVEYTLTIHTEGQGSTIPAEGAHEFDEGTVVDLAATADEGWEFEKWVIDGADVMDASTQVTMDGDITAVAHFAEEDEDGLPAVVYNGVTLYVQPEDHETRMQWGADGIETGASSTTNGQANTQLIVGALKNNKGILYGALYCDNLTYAGFDDWYLPALEELDAVYQEKENVGDFEYNNYWTSTENGAFFAYRQYFTNGYQESNAMKINNSGVRCVRRED